MIDTYLRFPGGKPKAVTLSYDDGIEEDIEFIELLNQYGLKCTFNLNSDEFFDEPQVFKPGKFFRRMTKKAAIQTYKNSGHEIGVHTLHHLFLAKLPTARMIEEVLDDRRNLEKMFATEVRGMAYPLGSYNDTAVDVCKYCGIAYSRTIEDSHGFEIPTDWLRLQPTCHHNDERLEELTEEFINTKVKNRAFPDGKPMLFYLWGHTYEFERDNNWEVIEKFAQTISGKEDIWYATNIEIHDYVEAYRALRFSADGQTVYNPTCIPVELVTDTGNTFKIEPGQYVTLS